MIFKRFKLLLNRDIFKATSIYTLSGILTKAIPFLLLPVFTHYLSASDYGIISLVSSSILALIPFINLGITDLITIESKKRERENYKIFEGTALTASLVFCLLTSVLAILFTKYFSQLSTLPAICVLLIPVLTYFNFCNDLLVTVVRNDEKRVLYVVLNVLKTSIELGLAIILIVWFKMQWMGRIDGMLLTGTVFTFFLFYYVFKNKGLRLNLNINNLRSIAKFGVATIPLYFMIFSLYNADKFMISKILDSKEKVGLYTIAFQIGYMINVFETAFYTAFLPKLYDWLKENSIASKIKIVKSIYISTSFMIFAGIGLYIFSPLLYRFFIDAKYNSSISLLPYFIISFVLWNVFASLLPIIFYFKKTNYLFYINTATISINLVSLYFFTKWFGLVGACYSNILSFSFLIFFISFFSNKTYRLPWLYFFSTSKSA
jgi:O-antigen/teichoic acid export membrane protein